MKRILFKVNDIIAEAIVIVAFFVWTRTDYYFWCPLKRYLDDR